MKYFLFHKPTGGQPDFIRAFKTRAMIDKYIEQELDHLRKIYPKEKWKRSAYLIAERINAG